MLNAKDFFKAAQDKMIFDVCAGDNWFRATREQMIEALDTATLYEEIYSVCFFKTDYEFDNDFSCTTTTTVCLWNELDPRGIGTELPAMFCA